VTNKSSQSGQLTCSFCGKAQEEVKKLIAGPAVYICDECIELCKDIIAEEAQLDEPASRTGKLPKPAEIKEILDDFVVGQERARKSSRLRSTTTISGSKGSNAPVTSKYRRATSCS